MPGRSGGTQGRRSRIAERLSTATTLGYWYAVHAVVTDRAGLNGWRRVYCYHVPKTAGTSLHHSFMALGGENPADVWQRLNFRPVRATRSGRWIFARDPRLIRRGLFTYGFEHTPHAGVSVPPGTFTLTVFRDPVERFISYFRYIHDDYKGYEPSRRERPKVSRELRAFVESIPRRQLLNQLFMFSPRFDVGEAAAVAGQLTGVLYTEQFDQGLAELGPRLGVTLSPQRERVTVSEVEVTATEREWLREQLRPEYEFLAKLGGPYAAP